MTGSGADYSGLLRPEIAGLEAYTPILPFEIVSEQLGRPASAILKLDANENPFGPSPRALQALAELGTTASIYPDPEYRRLREGLAGYTGVEAKYIMVGAGADELIDLIMRLFLSAGERIINCPPTFLMYAFDASLAGAHTIDVLRRADFSIDLPGIEQAVAQHHPKIVFLTSPNNPDGSLIAREDLLRLLDLPVMIVLDEAYYEFSGAESSVGLVPQHPNLIVLRTFSKWAGLAGMRIGYGVFPEWVMAHLWKLKQPYNVSVAADMAARASLEDLTLLRERVQGLIQERERLAQGVAAIPYLEELPSAANFILCRVLKGSAAALRQRLARDYGILIRHYNKPGLQDYIRISIGVPGQTERLLDALREIERGL
ncbi:MAG: histidinol-phosphate transaminase [Anaerolineae bacterium]|nr:histidinol-phosphate transaminase [Anaerolineae bacterium]